MKTLVKKAIEDALKKLNQQAEVEVVNSTGHGDLSSNVAFKLTKAMKLPPKGVAEKIIENIDKAKYQIDKVEFAAPGFLNFYLNNSQKNQIINDIMKKGDTFGKGDIKKYVNIEFVSANPTGFLHVGHARGAAFGDALANIMAFAGMKVDKEYYINDAGMQIKDLGTTTYWRYQELCGKKIDTSNLAYSGNEIIEAAKEIKEKCADKYKDKELSPEVLSFFSTESKNILLKKIKEHLALFNVHMKTYYSEESLYENDRIKKVIEGLPKEYVYKKDGATWLATTKFGDDKDRVLIKKDGSYTYFAPDVVYHNIKASRGYDQLIDVFGADHSGYVKRMQIAMEISGYKNKLRIPIVQMVRLVKNGKEIVMSKRRGTAYTLIQLINEVGTDAARFYLLNRTLDSKMDFDINLATSKSNDNPVIYVQYAYARACQLLKKAKFDKNKKITFKDGSLGSKQEQLILDVLWQFPELITSIAKNLKVNLLNAYVMNLAKLFHSFYNNNKVIGAKDEQEKLFLIASIAQILKNSLKLLGINAPERMDYEK